MNHVSAKIDALLKCKDSVENALQEYNKKNKTYETKLLNYKRAHNTLQDTYKDFKKYSMEQANSDVVYKTKFKDKISYIFKLLWRLISFDIQAVKDLPNKHVGKISNLDQLPQQTHKIFNLKF
jgi:hypothetical protein